MKAQVKDAIQFIKTEKESRNLFPTYALKMQILNVIRQRTEIALEELVNDGELTTIETLNDMAYE